MSTCAKTDVDLPQVAQRQVHLLILVAPQVLRLESRVLELELHRKHAAPTEADPEPCQVPIHKIGHKARRQSHSDHCRLQATMSACRA